MKVNRSNIVLIILLVNITGLPFLISTTRTSDSHNHILSSSKLDRNSSSEEDVLTNSDYNTPSLSFSIQQENSTIINNTVDNGNDSFSFVNNIWDDPLNSDPHVLAYPELYENGIIYPAEGDIDTDALFIRIGNNGTDNTNLDTTLNTNISSGISAGWKIDFPVTQEFDVLKVSFKWRFDAFDPPAFDNYTELIPGVPLDASPDYQEIRCRINPPSSTQESFWLGNIAADRNPFGSVFYRVGPNITQDEEWFNFTGSFHVPMNNTANYTLDLGAYLNTREYWNEFFDVWFDDILIEGITDPIDNNSPATNDYGLSRFEHDNTSFLFWTNLTTGSWESLIENATVYYNLTRDSLNTSLNTSLVESDYFSIDSAGFNNTHWNFTAIFAFSDIVSYKFVIFDEANNSYTTPTTVTTIDDVVAPWIPPDDKVLISQSGDGNIQILVNVTDWGFGVDKVIINYSIDGVIQPLLVLSNIEDILDNGVNITLFGVNLTVNYGSLLNFELLFNDSSGNHDSYLGYPFVADSDSIYPTITDFFYGADNETEDRSYLVVRAQDSFGEIDRVLLIVRSPNGAVNSSVLKYDNISDSFIPQGLDNLLVLDYVFSEEPYNLTVFVRDKEGLETSSSELYTVEDIIAPEISAPMENIEYLYPGKLRVNIGVKDTGSGLNNVSLIRKQGSSWTVPLLMDSEKGDYFDLSTELIGNQKIVFKIIASDNSGNLKELTIEYTTPLFVTTPLGLLFSEVFVVVVIAGLFAALKFAQKQQLRTVRRHRFDVATRRSERLSYLGEEAMFGFVAAYGKGESITSTLLWEPGFIGHFYQYLKELVDRANNSVDFVMQTRADDIITYVDFSIEEISCTAVVFAYPVALLPQKWLSSLSLEQTPSSTSQGVLMLMLLMRDKWSEVSHSFQDEIRDGMHDIKNYILAEEDQETIIKQIQDFRLFISGTVEIMEEIETESDDVTDSIMSDFEMDFTDESKEPEDNDSRTNSVNKND